MSRRHLDQVSAENLRPNLETHCTCSHSADNLQSLSLYIHNVLGEFQNSFGSGSASIFCLQSTIAILCYTRIWTTRITAQAYAEWCSRSNDIMKQRRKKQGSKVKGKLRLFRWRYSEFLAVTWLCQCNRYQDCG